MTFERSEKITRNSEVAPKPGHFRNDRPQFAQNSAKLADRYTATMAKTARILGTVSLFCAGFLALFAINIVGWIGLVDFIWGIVALLAVLGVFAIIYGNALDRTDHRLVTELGLEAAHEEKDGLRQSDTQDSRLNR